MGGGSCGISGCPSVEEQEDGERFPKEDQCSAASPTHPYPPPGCSHSASPLTAHLVTTITPPSSSPPSPRLPLYLPPLLHLPSLSNSPSLTLSGTHITHTTHTTHTILPLDSQYVPHSLPFLHFSWEAAPDSQMSLACQKLLLTFQFSGVFFSYCSLLMPYSRRTFTCQWARQKKGGRVCLLPFWRQWL